MDKKVYFVVTGEDDHDRRALCVVDIRDGIMMLSVKKAKGGTGTTQLPAEVVVSEIRIACGRVTFSCSGETVNHRLIAAFEQSQPASDCYGSPNLTTMDLRWRSETQAVAEWLGVHTFSSCGACTAGCGL